MHSKNNKAVIEEQLGFSNVRGRSEASFEAQLEKQLQTSIQYNSQKTFEELQNHFSHVVMATGDGSYSKKTQNFREDLTVSLKGATVEGNFDRYTVATWMNYDIAPFGIANLIPFSETKANLTLAIPEQKIQR
ncbi:hypothetical protein [Salibacterium aidingense]|uniref:hypothetical protein n=1 Tax=Salibacterium aidingense TaxID=384933 RepID=UPI003BD44C26